LSGDHLKYLIAKLSESGLASRIDTTLEEINPVSSHLFFSSQRQYSEDILGGDFS
jgi:hypothetical protein